MEKNSMTEKCSLLVIGGSAGSLDVIFKILPGLKTDLSFPVIIVLHRKSDTESLLTELLATRTKLVVKEADEKEEILPGHIYLAPADYHLLVEKNGTISLDFSEKINFSRPSIDATFETASHAFGNSAAGLLLSGASADGAKGLQMINRLGGITMVQDPTSAEVPYMPQQAMALTQIQYILTPLQMADFINSL